MIKVHNYATVDGHSPAKSALILKLGARGLFEFTHLEMQQSVMSEDDDIVRSVFRHMCTAVIELHNSGFMHCDIKLENTVRMPAERTCTSANTKFLQTPDLHSIRLIDFEMATS